MWFLDEMSVKINGYTHYIGRAYGHEGKVLESCSSETPRSQDSIEIIEILMCKNGQTSNLVVDKLKSHRTEMIELSVTAH